MATPKLNRWTNIGPCHGSINSLMEEYHKSKARLANQVLRVPYHVLQEVMGGVKLNRSEYDALRWEIVHHIENCPRALSSWREAAQDYLRQLES